LPKSETEIPDPPVKKEASRFRIFKLLLKITVTVICFWYISRKINFSEAANALKKADWWFLLLAVLALALSKLLASFRLNIYFRNINIHLPQRENIKLYWLGMFYNLFLPGAISGDAYKVIVLKKKFDVSYKKITAAVLLDRFSGLLALALILSAYGIVVMENKIQDIVLITVSLGAVIAFSFIVKFIFKDFIPGLWPTFLWGVAVQALQVICMYCIMKAVHLPLQQAEWIFIFLTAAVISVIPISLGGGLGVREFVFREGAIYFALNPSIAVIISLLFYLCNVLTSAGGAYFIFHDPLKEENGKKAV